MAILAQGFICSCVGFLLLIVAKKWTVLRARLKGLDSKVVGIEGIMAKMSGWVGISEQAVSAHDKRFDQFEE